MELPENKYKPNALYGEPGAKIEKFYIPQMTDDSKIAAAEMTRLRNVAVEAIRIGE